MMRKTSKKSSASTAMFSPKEQKEREEEKLQHARQLMGSLATNELNTSYIPSPNKGKVEERVRPEILFMGCVNVILNSSFHSPQDEINIRAFHADFEENLTKDLQRRKPDVYSNVKYIVDELNRIMPKEKQRPRSHKHG